MAAGLHTDAVGRVAERVRELADRYEPPSFAHVPNVDAAIFLCAIDHRTGYRGRYLVGGHGPFEGSALLWAVGIQAAERDRGLLTAAGLRDVSAERIAELFRIGGESVAEPGRRAELWRDLAAGLERDHGGEAEALLGAAGGRLGGAGWVARSPGALRGVRRSAGARSRSCSRRSASGAAGWRSTTPRAGRCAPTTS